MKYKTIKYKKKGLIAYIILDLPENDFSIRDCMFTELLDVCDIISQDNSINVLVVKISGETLSLGTTHDANSTICEAINAVAGLEKIVVAVINGDAIGEGLELALACDVRIASDRSRFALPSVSNGSIPSSGGTQRLPRLIGQANALELILTATMIDAAEAFRIGLVQKIIPYQDIDKEADILIKKIAEKAPIALRFCKEAVNKGMDLAFEQGLRLEADLYFLIQTTSDRMEGIKAFLEKRPPTFKGE
ncbi:MAG: enoyl-CoA hydratase-related protein [Dehalococcoidia bacterium]|jgi:enoyl-CoA hydratase/carnithine racemase